MDAWFGRPPLRPNMVAGMEATHLTVQLLCKLGTVCMRNDLIYKKWTRKCSLFIKFDEEYYCKSNNFENHK